MNGLPRRLWVVALAGLVLSLATPAGAQPVVDVPRIEVVTPPEGEKPPKPPEPPTERARVVSVRGLRGDEPTLARALTEHLRRRGLPVVEAPATETAPPCNAPECLEEMVKHDDIGFLLFAQVDDAGFDTSAITMTLYDVVRRASLQETASCWQCSRELLGYKLNDIADVLISRCRDGRQGGPVPNQTLNAPLAPPVVAPPAKAVARGPAPAGRHHAERGLLAKLPPSRRVLVRLLGGLAGAALLTSVILTATDGVDTPLGCDLRQDVLQDKCILKNKPLYATGYALTGALAIGIGFTLFWPTKPAPAPAPTPAQAPEVR